MLPRRPPVRNSSISPTNASVSPTRRQAVLALEPDELRAGDALGQVGRVARGRSSGRRGGAAPASARAGRRAARARRRRPSERLSAAIPPGLADSRCSRASQSRRRSSPAALGARSSTSEPSPHELEQPPGPLLALLAGVGPGQVVGPQGAREARVEDRARCSAPGASRRTGSRTAPPRVGVQRRALAADGVEHRDEIVDLVGERQRPGQRVRQARSRGGPSGSAGRTRPGGRAGARARAPPTGARCARSPRRRTRGRAGRRRAPGRRSPSRRGGRIGCAAGPRVQAYWRSRSRPCRTTHVPERRSAADGRPT